jgi:leader peptidase (prepilin peptidase)/N-methyltransferase
LTVHLLFMAVIILLIAATYTDLKERLIYDRFILIGLVFSLSIHVYERTLPWSNYILTGLGVFVFLAVIAILTKGNAIGGGDIKLFAMIGFAVGFESLLSIFILSHVTAAVWILGKKLIVPQAVSRHSELPFAPFILLATVLTYLVLVAGN